MEKRAITIVGLSGCGKSTVGKLLSQALGLPFIDTDKEIEKETGISVPEIFDRFGEKTFREIEKRVVLRSIESGGVISLGGGAILDPESREAILEKSVSFYIKVSIDELERRLRPSAEDRPLLRGNLRDRLEKLYNARKALYEMAHHTIEGEGLSPEEICALMAMRLNGTFEEREIHSSIHEAHIKRIRWEELEPFPLVTTPTIRRIYGSFIRNARIEILPDGEEAKELRIVEGLYRRLMEWGIERKDKVISLGGGALSDAVGFTCATFKRGCRLALVPTTLLAQVDASIGGKTAINLGEVKNVVGTFKTPDDVFIDPTFTLSQAPKGFAEGLVEAIKIASVASRELFEFIEENLDEIKRRNLKLLSKLIGKAVELKLLIAGKDLFDGGIRQILNFGHTLGHAIESSYSLSHGESVSLGMIFALKLGKRLGITREEALERIHNLLKGINMPTELGNPDLERLIMRLSQDKKLKGGKVNFVLIKDIGESRILPIDLNALKSYIEVELPRMERSSPVSEAFLRDEAFQVGR